MSENQDLNRVISDLNNADTKLKLQRKSIALARKCIDSGLPFGSIVDSFTEGDGLLSTKDIISLTKYSNIVIPRSKWVRTKYHDKKASVARNVAETIILTICADLTVFYEKNQIQRTLVEFYLDVFLRFQSILAPRPQSFLEISSGDILYLTRFYHNNNRSTKKCHCGRTFMSSRGIVCPICETDRKLKEAPLPSKKKRGQVPVLSFASLAEP